MRQFNSLTISDDGTKAVLTCTCGLPEHGVLMLDKTEYVKDEHEVAFSFWAVPNAWSFRSRLRAAIDVFFGRPISVDLEISANDGFKLATWLKQIKVGRDI